jgi:phytoene dehydrogenase-like protein
MDEHRPLAEAIVCGAGTAGLAAAASLRAVGVEVIVLERTEEIAASWRTRYDGLRLNTTGWMSTQPGYRASRRRYREFPSRDAWIRYLEDCPARHAETADSLSLAMLVLLESLSPEQRAVLLLHDVFDYGYPQISAGWSRCSPTTCS